MGNRILRQSNSRVSPLSVTRSCTDNSSSGQLKIEHLANEMGLGVHIKNGARRFLGLAVDNKFNRGRKTEYIIASCLYLQCRLQNDSHMLIDFSERLRVGRRVSPSDQVLRE